MGKITSLFVHKVIDQTHDSLDKRALLSFAGVDPAAPVDPKIMVTDEQYYAYLERIARTDPNAIDLPLRVGASMRCDEYGAFGLAWKSALNLRSSCERAERYARILTSVTTYEVRDSVEGIYMMLHRDGERRLGLRLSNEASIASIAAISQEVAPAAFGAEAIFFKHPAPGSTTAHEQHFSCPVHFGADRDALLISPESMKIPNKRGDSSILQFFDDHLDRELLSLSEDVSLERRIKNEVSASLCEGVPTLSDIGSRFGMSGRTLQRRLSEKNYSFQTLVDEARRELAERLLRDTAYSLAEVAFLTGFSEQSAFTRAFKRWAGQTPRSFRLSPN